MWASPKTQLRLAADRQDDVRRTADAARRSPLPIDGVDVDPHVRTPVSIVWRPVVARLMAALSRS